MPELPDVAILADALDVVLAGRSLTGSKIAQTLVLRGTPAELAAFEGQRLLDVTRRGKFLVFRFERDRIVFNPMLTGRLGVVRAGEKAWPQWAAMFE
ncbi:MAG TPA: DNA-formamidopyrimidine glycosylase family protein, partial [Candidatus Limnocylindria bacterium]|nr:DNA-formamidopyrimidine glycosylase family protein [Candidatus Limnocylindria bacterium]